ncbi:flagellar hook-basal body complex protein FliE [Burkholderia sp. AW33-5]|uniref:flagellar hook-basal body complex protein FliE n=1 Tax=Burkholderia sp. RF4-BP95 TaxID=1637845 RepID=UPI000754BCAE|nr:MULTISPECIES: flagellar hook-basal body complex protein FliE [Burkholderia]KUY72477.1 flagellar hook-basal body protein FliE [Burkholderia sp. RF4-BP95]CAG9246901.1 Flagellar hook-basal body complex protein FliE [Burkholderia diffusa]
METIQQARSGLHREMTLLGSPTGLPAAAPGREQHDDINFSRVMRGVLNAVDRKQVDAADRAAAVDSGQSDDLIGAMLASQEASLSFSMLTQVRNKLTTALDDLLKMQI